MHVVVLSNKHWRVWRVQRSLHVKDPFVVFEKEKVNAASKAKLSVPIHLPFFPVAFKNRCARSHPLFDIDNCWTCFRPEYAWNTCHWTIGNQQSIKKQNFQSLHITHFFQWQSKTVALLCPIPPLFDIDNCWSCFRSEYAWNVCHWLKATNNQSINHIC